MPVLGGATDRAADPLTRCGVALQTPRGLTDQIQKQRCRRSGFNARDRKERD